MATWDFGGGCPCGISKVCDCSNQDKYRKNMTELKNKFQQNVEEDYDFGFTTIHEDEIIAPSKDKLVGLRNMIMPLLTNLMKNSETTDIIKWPNRKQKIEDFIKKMDTYINA